MWGGMFKGKGAASSPTPCRGQVEEAAARAGGEPVDKKARQRNGPGGRDEYEWRYILMAMVVGVVALAFAGFATAKLSQGRP